jgi:hypothetical protein
MYQPGDEPATDQDPRLQRPPAVGQFEEETNPGPWWSVMPVVDIWTGSPDTRCQLHSGSSPRLLIHCQRDATGLITFDDDVRRAAASRASATGGSCLTLGALEAGPNAAAPALRRWCTSRRRGSLSRSDPLFDRELALKALRFLRHRGHQVLVPT